MLCTVVSMRWRSVMRLGKLDDGRVWRQVGTLGGGNHFIELCVDEAQSVWIMLHSGSRNIGNMIGQCAITMAREIAVKQNRTLPDRDLAWLDEGSSEFDEYVNGLRWAQDYAAINREVMLTWSWRQWRRLCNAPSSRSGRGQLPSQLRFARGAFRAAGVDYSQGRRVRARR
jgi:RNA-splicing ligase RtcB